MRLIFFFVLVSFVAWGQKTPATLVTENDATTYSAPFRIRNAFNDQILSNVNQRTPVFLDSADITKRIKFYLNGSHPTATTYNVTWPNKSGTVAFLDDVVSSYTFTTGLTESAGTVKWGGAVSGENAIVSVDATLAGTEKVGLEINNTNDLSGIVIETFGTGDGVAQMYSFLDGGGGAGITAAGGGIVFQSSGSGSFSWSLGSDAVGDMYINNASNVFARLAKGAEGTILRAGASVPAYSTFTIPNTISALSTFVSNTANVLTEVTPAAGQSIRVNAGGTAWEAYTPGGGSSVLSDITAATGANTINSGANHQIWDWNSLTSGTGMSFRSSSTGAASNTLKVVSIEKSGANATSSQTTTALNVSNTSTGTTSTNIGGYFEASGATTNWSVFGVGDILSRLSAAPSASRRGFVLQDNGGTERGFLGMTNDAVLLGSGSGYPLFLYGGGALSGAITTTGKLNWMDNPNNTSRAKLYVTHAVNNTIPVFRVDGAVDTNLPASTEKSEVNFNFNRNKNWATGALTTQREFLVQAPTYTFTGASTITDAYTMFVTGAPTAGTNATITRSWAAGFNGNTFIGGNLSVPVNGYINMGTTLGSSGYFLRDNAGVVEFKNSGQTWTPLGYLQPQLESGTSLTLDDLDVTQGIYTSNGSAVTITVPSTLPTGAVVTIMQEGGGTVSLSAGANVNIAGKTSTTGANDFIWLWLYKKDGGTSYYVGR